MTHSFFCSRRTLAAIALAALAGCTANSSAVDSGQANPDGAHATPDAAHATLDAAHATPDAAGSIDAPSATIDSRVVSADAPAAIDAAAGTDAAPADAATDGANVDAFIDATPDAAIDAAPDAYVAVCGNGIVDPNEVCDDGTNGDGICSADCQTSAFAGGDGTLARPYQIATSDQLISANNQIVANKSFQLIADLDLSGVTMEPIGFTNDSFEYQFSGSFDGGNHVISNWTYASSSGCVGLFSYNFGLVIDVVLKSPALSGGDDVGGIVGCNYGILARNHVLGGTITSGNEAGGVAGVSGGGNVITAIASCENSATVTGTSVGGIVGNQFPGSEVIDSFSTGTVQSTSVSGGLVGQQYSSTIYRSYASGDVDSTGPYIGGLVSYDEYPDSNDESFFSIDGTQQTNSVDGTGLTADQMTDATNFVGWDFTNVWSIAPGASPTLRLNGDVAPITFAQIFNPQGEVPLPMDLTAFDLQGDKLTYSIVTKPTLGTLSTFDGGVVTYTSSTWNGGVDSFVYQAADSLGLTSTPTTISVYTYAVCNNAEPGFTHGGDGTSGNPYVVTTVSELQLVHAYLVCNFVLGNDIDLAGIDFEPIGASTTPFNATFDGGGHQITNWTYSSDSSDHVGFFSSIRDGAVIENLGLTNESVTSTASYADGLVADADGGTISNVFTTGAVTGASDYTAGLVGTTSYTTIVSCHSDATINCSGGAAGLVGYDDSGGSISHSFATGDVTGSSAAGLVQTLDGVSLDRCYATGDVTATGGLAAGLVEEYIPESGGKITNCFSSGALDGGVGGAGGLIGEIFSQGLGAITNVYAVGKITTSSTTKGGLIAASGGNFGTVMKNCFWDTTTTGVSTTLANAGTPETDSAMLIKATYTGFDFTNVWSMGDSGYPQLR